MIYHNIYMCVCVRFQLLIYNRILSNYIKVSCEYFIMLTKTPWWLFYILIITFEVILAYLQQPQKKHTLISSCELISRPYNEYTCINIMQFSMELSWLDRNWPWMLKFMTILFWFMYMYINFHLLLMDDKPGIKFGFR